MAYFLSFRTQDVGGPIIDPIVLHGDGCATAPKWDIVSPADWQALIDARDIVFVTHGFNVSQTSGAYSLEWLSRNVSLIPATVFVGMLWPGDAWIPVVDYPFEGGVATDCGSRLAQFCDKRCGAANSLSFFSHSLGARVVLEAVAHIARKARVVCVAAGAVNRDCLNMEYWDASMNASSISVLASREDYVLKLAFALGDPVADLLHDDHTPFQAALGATGPKLPAPPNATFPWQIPDIEKYGHGDYLPPGQPVTPPASTSDKWFNVATFLSRALAGSAQTWP